MSWQQLLSVYEQQRQAVRDEPALRQQACPNDGEPYRVGPQGQLYCPFDGYEPGEAIVSEVG